MKPKKPIKKWIMMDRNRFDPYWIFNTKTEAMRFCQEKTEQVLPIYISFTKPE